MKNKSDEENYSDRTTGVIPCTTNFFENSLSDKEPRLLPLRVKDICLHKEGGDGGQGMVGKGQESAMGKVCLLCMGCLVAGFVGQSIVALLTLNLRDRRQEEGAGVGGGWWG